MSKVIGQREIVVLGCGYAGLAVAREARMQGARVLVHVRREERAAELMREGLSVWHAPELDAESVRARLEERHRPEVLVAFPPDGATDARLEGAFAGAGRVTYLSTTGVYGDRRGRVDEDTPVASDDARAAKWLEAEARYLRAEASVFRCAAIYGPDRGVHVRVIRGEHRLPGDGAQITSRIHVLDLARLILTARAPVGTFVVGDRHPAPHREVVDYVSRMYNVPFPPSIPLEEAHPTLRADRAVDSARILDVTGLTLRYPSFREGMAPGATGMPVHDAAGRRA